MISFALSFALAAAIPEIAYVEGKSLVLATRRGAMVRKIRMRVPLGAFSVTPDISTAAFTGKGKNQFGGPLYLHDVKSGRTWQPRGRPFWPAGPDSEPVDEVYADPAFSPDGNLLAFTIHSPPKNIPGDVVLASGPLALLALSAERVSLVDATLHVIGTADGPAYANSPAWSPDGKSLFVNFETGFAVAPAGGAGIRVSDRSENGFSNALAWIGTE